MLECKVIGVAITARKYRLAGGKVMVSELIRYNCGVYKIIESSNINTVNARTDKIIVQKLFSCMTTDCTLNTKQC